MSGEAWKTLDLKGDGLQSVNLQLAARLRKRGTAYALLALFTLGLHRDYLHDRCGAWLYRTGTLTVVVTLLTGHPVMAAGLAAVLVAAAVYDAFHVDEAVARVNRRLRVEICLGPGAGAPADFKGRHVDDSVITSHAPSFAEQEKMLRQITEIRRKNSG
ncbi:MAG: hypothetical protein KIT18_17745 [Burkholderiales bacterium]|nr:hypothetical protein [Burkholderiales bacterium]